MREKTKTALEESRDKLQDLVNILDEILSGTLSQSQAAQKLGMNIQKWDYTKKNDFLPFLRGLTPMSEEEVRVLLSRLHSPYENLVYNILGYSGAFREEEVLVLTIEDEEKIQRSMDGLLSERQRNILNDLYGFEGEGRKTFEETAEHLGLSKVRVRRDFISAIQTLRDPEFLKQFFQGYPLYIQRMEELSVLRTLNKNFQESLRKVEERWKVVEPVKDRLEMPLAKHKDLISKETLDFFLERGLITVKDLMAMDQETFEDCVEQIPELPGIFQGLQLPLSPEDYGDSPLLDEDIAILDLSIRSSNGLYRAGILTIGDLISYTPEEIANLRNIGKKSVDEICEKMEALGLSEIWKENLRER